jgi:hypothetical protein
MLGDRVQPASLAYAPPSYAGHDYTGPGDIVAVRLGADVVGHLTRQGDRLGFIARPGLSADAHTVRHIVEDTLREFAAAGRAPVDAWAECLRLTTHDAPVVGPLDGFKHPLAD